MGGRGEFYDKSGGVGILPEYRTYETVGVLEGVKIIQSKESENASQPPFSNTAGTMYFTRTKNDGRIKHISYYNKEHKIIRSVDIDFSGKGRHHAHIWESNATRIPHNPKNERPLTNRDKHYLELALKYNKENSKK